MNTSATMATSNPMDGTPMEGSPTSSTPNTRLAAMMQISGFQAMRPIGSPSPRYCPFQSKAVSVTASPSSARIRPSIKGK